MARRFWSSDMDDRRHADRDEARAIARYMRGTSVMRELRLAVDESARRADALHRLDLALRANLVR